MKKIFLSIFAVLSMISLVGCKKETESFTLDDKAKNTEIATTWLNSVTYNATAVNNDKIIGDEGYDAKKVSHFEVFLPTDILAETKVNILDIPTYDVHSTVYANYASTTAFGSSDYTLIIDILCTDDSIKAATGYEVLKSKENVVDPKDGFINAEKESKKLAVIYVPAKVNYVKYDSEGSRRMTIMTYVLAPIYATTTIKTNDAYDDTVVESYKSKPLTFKVLNGAIQ
ncbi:MAG: hypothetical protein ACI35W_02635 [Anaeroplasmataceae bacterium]